MASEVDGDGALNLSPSAEYFAKPGTVISWWDPFGADEVQTRWFLEQQQDLLGRCSVVGKRVLDGCTGRGRMAIAAAEAGATSIIGLDISEDMIIVARANAAQAGVEVDFRCGSVAQLELADESIDVAFCLEVLLHLDDPSQAITELYRVLARGGHLIITTVGGNPLARLTSPARRGAHPAGRLVLAAVTGLNEVMTAVFGFMWARSRPTSWLYSRIFRVPVRPLYRKEVERLLTVVGFSVQRWTVKAGPFVREHRWIARKR